MQESNGLIQTISRLRNSSLQFCLPNGWVYIGRKNPKPILFSTYIYQCKYYEFLHQFVLLSVGYKSEFTRCLLTTWLWTYCAQIAWSITWACKQCPQLGVCFYHYRVLSSLTQNNYLLKEPCLVFVLQWQRPRWTLCTKILFLCSNCWTRHHSTVYMLGRYSKLKGDRQGLGDFWAQPAKIRPFTTSTGFFKIWLVANLLPLIWTSQYPILFFKCWLISSSF